MTACEHIFLKIVLHSSELIYCTWHTYIWFSENSLRCGMKAKSVHVSGCDSSSLFQSTRAMSLLTGTRKLHGVAAQKQTAVQKAVSKSQALQAGNWDSTFQTLRQGETIVQVLNMSTNMSGNLIHNSSSDSSNQRFSWCKSMLCCFYQHSLDVHMKDPNMTITLLFIFHSLLPIKHWPWM